MLLKKPSEGRVRLASKRQPQLLSTLNSPLNTYQNNQNNFKSHSYILIA